jgi:hypothetical protein
MRRQPSETSRECACTDAAAPADDADHRRDWFIHNPDSSGSGWIRPGNERRLWITTWPVDV